MTEQEKMLSGQFYNSADPELCRQRLAAREILYDFNHSRPAQMEYRVTLLKKLFGSVAGQILIEQPFTCDYGSNIRVGDNFFANFNCVILDVCPVTIGSNVLLAPGVQIYTAAHPLTPALRLEFKEFGKPVTIGDNVWIGGCAVICPGVTLGDNSVIGAGSIVTKDIPANVVAAGNPCRVLKTL